MKYFYVLILYLLKEILNLELPKVIIKDQDGQEYETLDINDDFFKKNHVSDYQLRINEDVIEPEEKRNEYIKEAINNYKFDKQSLKQIGFIYYDKKIRDFLNGIEEDQEEDKLISKDEKTERDQKMIEKLDKNQEHITKIIQSQNDIIPSTLFKKKAIQHKVVWDISDSIQRSINKYVDDYVDKINKNRNQKYRFIEYEVKEEQKDFPPFVKAIVKKAWASSSLVNRQKHYHCYTYRYCRWWIFFCQNRQSCHAYYTYNNFQASNVLKQQLWMSIGNHTEKDIVTFKITLDKSYRLAYIYLSWASFPKEISIQTSNDDKMYIEQLPFSACQNWVVFGSPIWATQVKLLMRTPVNSTKRFGLYRFDAWTKNYKIMLRSKMNSAYCLIVANGDNNQQSLIQMMDCVQAISMMDGRELFQMLATDQITNDAKKCITNKGATLSKNNPIIIGDCAAKPENQWIMDTSDKIKVKGNENWCLTAVKGGVYENYALQAECNSTTSSDDNNHPCKHALDGSNNTYWQSSNNQPAEQFALKLTGSGTTVSIIKIIWKYPPQSFSIQILLSYNIWQTVYSNSKYSDDKININIVPSKILGIKILMNAHNTDKSKIANDLVYGISEIVLYANTLGVNLQSCAEYDSSKANQFIIEEYYYSDLKNQSNFEGEQQKLSTEGNTLSRITSELIPLPAILQKMLALAQDIKQRNQKISDELDEKDGTITEFRENFEKSYEKFRDKYLKGQERQSSGQLATNSDLPAESCSQIRKQFPYKISGFYWVQNECNPQSLRVFCDFSIHKGTFYAYFGSLKDGQTLSGISKIQDIQLKCAQLGLEPVQIDKESQIHTLKRYIENIRLKLKDTVIPIGYDYDCDISKCNGQFKSLKDHNTKDITRTLLSYIDTSNVKNSKFALKGRIDSIGFNYDKGKMSYFRLGTKEVKGIICSDNAFEVFGNVVDLNCSDSVRNNKEVQANMHTSIIASCPKDCGKMQEFEVYGSIMYRDDSSICRAAIHSGVLDDNKGGIVFVGIEKGTNDYKGSKNNKIITQSYNEYWERSFVLNEYVKRCPIDKFLNYKDNKATSSSSSSSFSQTKMRIKMKLRTRLKVKSKNRLRMFQDDQEKNQTEQGDKGGEKEKGLSTEQALEQLMKMHEIKLQEIKKFIHLVASAKQLIIEINKIQSPLAQSDLSSKTLASSIKQNAQHIIGTSSVFKEMNQDANNRMIETFTYLQNKIFKKMKMREWLPYKEKYDIHISIMYDIIDNPMANGPNSKWEVTTSNLNGHEKAIGQTMKRECASEVNCFATMAVLKIYRFYDFKLKVSILMKSDGLCGILFRVEDSGNYYVFEMKNLKFKRVKRCVKGVCKVIIQKNDGGFMQDVWYRVQITAQIAKFTIQMQEESKAGDDDNMPVVLEVEDQFLAQGRVGFSTNQMSGFFIDKFEYLPLKCITDEMKKYEKNGKIPREITNEKPIEEISYLPPQCSRYAETFKMKLDLLWKQLNHDSLSRGPPFWEIVKKYQKRENAIRQGVKIYSGSADQPGAILYLNYNRTCRDGVVNVDFLGEDDGYVGILFRMKSEQFFYILEVHGQMKKQVKLKKVKEGKYRLMATDTQNGYDKMQWYQLKIFMDISTFRFFLTNIKDGVTYQLFGGDIKDEEHISDGSIGISSFLTRAAFDQIQIYPFSDIPKPKEDVKGEVPIIQPLEPASPNKPNNLEKSDKKKRKEENKKKEEDKTAQDIKLEKIEEQQITWDECLINTNQYQRSDYCQKLFSFDINAYNFCNQDYCGTCCDKVIDGLHTVQRATCKKECIQSTEQLSGGIPYKSCLESDHASKSAQSFCKMQFLMEIDQMRCNQGFCDLCCITIIVSKNIDLSDEVVNQCHTDCEIKYALKDDLFAIPPEQASPDVQKMLIQAIESKHIPIK